jgi:hypothetical protein
VQVEPQSVQAALQSDDERIVIAAARKRVRGVHIRIVASASLRRSDDADQWIWL